MPEEMVASLDLAAKKEKLSRAALVRAAIDSYLEKGKAQAVETAFGLWKGRQTDGLAYQSRLRDEWTS